MYGSVAGIVMDRWLDTMMNIEKLCINRQTDGQADKLMDGWTDKLVDGGMMVHCSHVCILATFC